MRMATRWSATNRLVQRLRRHGALATLFRSPLKGEVSALPTPPQWVLGRAAASPPAGDPAPPAGDLASAVTALDAWLPFAASAAPVDAAQETHTLAATTPHLHQPAQRATAIATPAAQLLSPPSTPAAQEEGSPASGLPGASFAPATTATTSTATTSTATVSAADVSTAAVSAADAIWQRLQQIRRLHENQRAAPPEHPAPDFAALQRASTSETLPPAPTFPVMPAAAGTSPVNDDEDGAGQPSPSPGAEGGAPPTVMRAAAPAASVANQASAITATAAYTDPARASRAPGAPDQHPAAVQARRAEGDAPITLGTLPASSASEEASNAADAPVHEGLLSSQAGIDAQQPPAAPLETAWPAVQRTTAHASAERSAPMQSAAFPPGSAPIAEDAVDAVRRQMASIDTGSVTESKVDLIAPRRPPPGRQAPARGGSSPFQVQAAEHIDGTNEVFDRVVGKPGQPQPFLPESIDGPDIVFGAAVQSASNCTWDQLSAPPTAVQAQARGAPPQKGERTGSLQRAVVETEIGALPADLWRVIGVTPPSPGAQGASDPGAVSAVGPPTLPTDAPTALPSSLPMAANTATPLQRAAAGAPLTPTLAARDGTLAPASFAFWPVAAAHRSASPAARTEGEIDADTLALPGAQPAQPEPGGRSAVQRTPMSQVVSALPADESMQAELPHFVAMHLHSNEALRQPAADIAPAPAGVDSQTVQLTPAPEAAWSQAAVDAGSQAAWPAGTDSGDSRHPVDVDDLAQKVYRQLRRRLLLEWERLRPVRD